MHWLFLLWVKYIFSSSNPILNQGQEIGDQSPNFSDPMLIMLDHKFCLIGLNTIPSHATGKAHKNVGKKTVL